MACLTFWMRNHAFVKFFRTRKMYINVYHVNSAPKSNSNVSYDMHLTDPEPINERIKEEGM